MLLNALRLALREIRRNLLRSALTILGIVIGVAAVITMVTLGGGATAKITGDLAGLGNNLLIVQPGVRTRRGGIRTGAAPLTRADAHAIARDVTGVSVVAPAAITSGVTVYGNTNWSTTIIGAENTYFPVRTWSILRGRPFTEGELRTGKAVCVVGATVRAELFGSQEPLGASIRVGSLSCQVIGLLAAKGKTIFGTDQDDLLVMPLRTLHRRITGNRDITIIYATAESREATAQVQQDIEGLMRQRRRITPGAEDDFEVRDLAEVTRVVQNTTRILTTFLGAIAAISLLVGGIGIMNILLVSVTERTREIGIRLAIGAFERDVLVQFLVEAVVLSLVGGLMGIGLGLGCSILAAQTIGIPFILDGKIVVLAFTFSGIVGIVFGFFPARRAARLDPIEALRYE